MKKCVAFILAGMIGLSLLAGCGQTETDTPEPTVSTTGTSAVTTTVISAETDTPEPSSTTEPSSTAEPSQTEGTTADTTRENTTTTVKTTAKKPTVTKKPTTTQKTTTKKQTTTTTTTTKKVTTTTVDPNRVTINGKAYAVGDTIHYTVMVKTTQNYGTVTVGVRCRQKGLEIPSGTFQKQNQYVMKNIGIGRSGIMPEDTIGKNGFTMTANKGYALDFSAGNAGLLWFYETTNYDFSAQAYREVDCAKGVALFTIALKITKPGEYTIDCMEYPNKSRSDLTVWGEFS